MHSGLVFGCGRSGTSLVSGVVSRAGYYQGSNLVPEDESNPKGYFEDYEISQINEDLLTHHAERFSWTSWQDRRRNRALGSGLRWLSVMNGAISPKVGRYVAARIEAEVRNTPFLFKDPRISYTLPAWRPHLPEDCRYIVAFRDPIRTAESIVRRAQLKGYADSAKITIDRALSVWLSAYEAILTYELDAKVTLYVSYDSVVSGAGAKAVGCLLDAPVDGEFADASVSRSRPVPESELSGLSARMRRVFAKLLLLEAESITARLSDGNGRRPESRE